jgi:hypothetical protein
MDYSLIKFDITDSVINQLEQDFMPLKVDGIEDKDGLKKVHDARMVVKGLRVDVQKREKELKAEALAWNRKVGADAKSIYVKLEPIETHLKTEEDSVKKALEEIEKKKEQEREAAVKMRMDRLIAVGVSMAYTDVATMEDEEFEIFMCKAEDDYRQKKEAEEAAAKELAEKEAFIKEAEEAAAKELAEKKAAFEAKLKEVEEREAKAKALEDEIRLKKEAEEKALREEAEAKLKAEEEAAAEELKKTIAEKLKLMKEEFEPDKEKLTRLSENIRGHIINSAGKLKLKSDIGKKGLDKFVADIVEITLAFDKKVSSI